MTKEARSIRCPESVLGWIPWYGEIAEDGDPLLDARQRGAVEAHASECTDCRAELDLISGAPYEIDVDLPDPDRMFEAITARIDAGEAEGLETAPIAPDMRIGRPAVGSVREESPTSLSDDEIRRLTSWVLDGDRQESAAAENAAPQEEETGAAPSAGAEVIQGRFGVPNVWAAVAAAAIFVLGIVGGGLLGDANGLSAGAETYDSAAATDEALATIAPGDALLDVVFVDSATAGEIGTALRSAGVEIISGPSGVGRYRVRVVDEGVALNQADLVAITARLKSGPTKVALFAEPVLR